MSKRFLSITLVALALCFFASSCVKEAGFENRVREIVQADSLRAQVEALAAQMRQMNTDISSLQKVVSALEKNLYITNVTETEEGCTLTFSDGTSVTIKNGKDGKDGKDAPVVGVKDTLGIYYWVLVDKTTTPADTSWILDNEQNKIRVTGEDGKDGAEIGVKESLDTLYWVKITTDITGAKDTAWLVDKSGNMVKAEGKDGDSMFSGIDTSKEGYVILTLTAGGTITLPYKSELDKLVARIQKIDVIPDYGDGSVKLNNGWNLVSFAISPDSLAPKLKAGFDAGKTKFTFLMIQTLTKAVTYDTLYVTNVEVESNGNLEVTVRGEKIKSYYHKENGKTGNGCLKISDTVNCCTSGYFSLSRAKYPGFKDTLCYAVKDIVFAPVNCGYDATNYKYGKLYQWGRAKGCGYVATDGTSTYNDAGGIIQATSTTTTPIAAESESETTFYKITTKPYDWLTPQNNARWNSGMEASPVRTQHDPCPSGWRVPTVDELTVLRGSHESGGLQDGTGVHSGMKGKWFDGSTGAQGSGVFLPVAGYRSYSDGSASSRGTIGYYWSSSSSASGVEAMYLYFSAYSASIYNDARAKGFSVRCVQE